MKKLVVVSLAFLAQAGYVLGQELARELERECAEDVMRVLPDASRARIKAAFAEHTAKYRKIFECLRNAIRDGRYPRGVPLPSEESLVRKYKVSRITAIRAMDELVKYGLVYRKRGAGTFATKAAEKESGRLGLIMPSLSFGEVFPCICQGLMRCAVTMFPPLTTVHQPCEDIALVAYRALRERMRDPSLPPRRILVPAPLVVRESTRR